MATANALDRPCGEQQIKTWESAGRVRATASITGPELRCQLLPFEDAGTACKVIMNRGWRGTASTFKKVKKKAVHFDPPNDP